MSDRQIDQLIWDDWNRQHIEKHGVLPEEAEQVLKSSPFVREIYKERLLLVGQTAAGQFLTVVVSPVSGRNSDRSFYVVSARPASRKDRIQYAQAKGASQ